MESGSTGILLMCSCKLELHEAHSHKIDINDPYVDNLRVVLLLHIN